MEHDTEPCGPPDFECDDIYPAMLLQARYHAEILDGTATAAGMNRLFDGEAKDTVKK